ncbi:MAG: molybdopterin-dependent oxidoreductase [Pirellulaceae bacterium]
MKIQLGKNVMDSERRSFLKSAAMVAAGSMVAGGTSLPVVQADEGVGDLPVLDGLSWNKAPCRFCGTGCHVQVGVESGRVVAIAGDKAADVNKGLLCVKGYHVGGILYGKDRLTKPLLRKGDQLEEIEWDAAIEIIAKRIFDSPKTFAVYGSGQWTIPEGYAAQKFMKGGLGNNHIDPNARLCMASAVTGFLATYGVDEPAGCYQDLDECDVLITWGNNPAEMHPVLFSRNGPKIAWRNGAIIDIGTRRTRTTDAATDYLEMKPHGDVAISLGIMHC